MKPAHFENCAFLLRSDEWIFLGCDTPYLHSKKNCYIDNLFPPPVDTSRGGSVAKQYLSGSSPGELIVVFGANLLVSL